MLSSPTGYQSFRTSKQQTEAMGDSLEADWEEDDQPLSGEGEEEEDREGDEDQARSKGKVKTTSKKRKRAGGVEDKRLEEVVDEEEGEEDPAAAAAAAKKKKKKEKFKALKAAKREARLEDSKKGSVTLPQQMKAPGQATFLEQSLSSLLPPLSSVEQLSLQITQNHIAVVNSSQVPPPSNGQRAATHLPPFIKAAIPTLTTLHCDKKERIKGSPFCLVLSSSAVRANELAKALRQQLHHLKSAKLFGKHIKVEDQQKALEEAFHALAVGTPARVKKLLELGALSLAATRLVVLDMNHDAKSFHVLNLPGVAAETAALLRSFVVTELGKGQLKLALF